MTDAIKFDASMLNAQQQKKLEKAATQEEKIAIFQSAKNNKNLSRAEEKSLIRENGLTEDQIKLLKKMDGGEEMLNTLAYAHLDSETFGLASESKFNETLYNFLTTKPENGEAKVDVLDVEKLMEYGVPENYATKRAKEHVIQELFVDPNASYEDIMNKLQTDYGEKSYISEDPNLIRKINEKFVAERQKDKIAAIVIPEDNNKAQNLHVKVEKNDQDKVESITMYEYNNPTAEGVKLTKEGNYFVDNTDPDNPKYYSYNDVGHRPVLSDRTTQVLLDQLQEQSKRLAEKAAKLDAEAKAAEEAKQAEAERAKFEAKENMQIAFDKIRQNGVTIDETGSKQRLSGKEQWHTNVVIPKKANKDNAMGIPSQIAIELPGQYGSKGPDGVAQKRYQTLYLDEKTQTYSDKRGLRQFQVVVGDDGKITLKQVNVDDAKVKATLDKDTKAVQEKAHSDVLNDKYKMDLDDKTEAQAKNAMRMLSDRNTSWEYYTQVGTENGYITGAHGLLEEIVDESEVTGVKTYNDLKPAIDGLLARVPESVKDTPEYKAVQDIVTEMAKTPDTELKTHWYQSGNKVRELDKAMFTLAEKHLAGTVQGSNFAQNRFLVGGRGAVVITPNKESGMWNTDAIFTIGEDGEFTLHSGSRTVDFQDLIEHGNDGTRDKLSFIRNVVTGDNRHGEIDVDEKVLDALVEANNGKVRLKGSDDAEYKIAVVTEDSGPVAYIYSPDGSVKVPLEDVLNGRAKMPKNPAP